MPPRAGPRTPGPGRERAFLEFQARDHAAAARGIFEFVEAPEERRIGNLYPGERCVGEELPGLAGKPKRRKHAFYRTKNPASLPGIVDCAPDRVRAFEIIDRDPVSRCRERNGFHGVEGADNQREFFLVHLAEEFYRNVDERGIDKREPCGTFPEYLLRRC